MLEASGNKTTLGSSFWEMLHGDAYHRKSFAVGVVQRVNLSTLATSTVVNKKKGINACTGSV